MVYLEIELRKERKLNLRYHVEFNFILKFNLILISNIRETLAQRNFSRYGVSK